MLILGAMRRVLGIDPGLRITGYGVVDIPAALGRPPRVVEAGVFRLSAKKSMEHRLMQLEADLVALIEECKPEVVAVEKLYAHYKHPRTAILMGHARGVILLAAARKELPVIHLPSTEVKKAVTGYGHASKAQMQRSIQAILSLPEAPSPPDVADALAIALTAARRHAAV